MIGLAFFNYSIESDLLHRQNQSLVADLDHITPCDVIHGANRTLVTRYLFGDVIVGGQDDRLRHSSSVKNALHRRLNRYEVSTNG